MLNYIWGFMIIAGVIFGGVRGADVVSLVADGALDSGKEAIELCITMLGVVGLWSGIMNIAKEAGLIAKWTKGIDPALTFLFPKIPKGHPVREDIATNMIANILGLGWAATPAGLKAMKGLAKLRDENDEYIERRKDMDDREASLHNAKNKKTDKCNKSIATNEMCTFLVINISSLQLIPVNIIAYRSEYGSGDPTAIIGPALAATLCTTIVAVVLCKVMCKKINK